MNIEISVDIEDEIRKGLSGYITTYCRPLQSAFLLLKLEKQVAWMRIPSTHSG